MKGLDNSCRNFPTKSDEVLEGRRILGEKWYLDKRRKEINIFFFSLVWGRRSKELFIEELLPI